MSSSTIVYYERDVKFSPEDMDIYSSKRRVETTPALFRAFTHTKEIEHTFVPASLLF